MAWFTRSQMDFAEVVSNLAYCNPFAPERIEFEKAALGSAFKSDGADWNTRGHLWEQHPNLTLLHDRAGALAETLAAKLREGGAKAKTTPSEVELYEDLVLIVLHDRFRDDFDACIAEVESAEATPSANRAGNSRERRKQPFIKIYDRFESEWMRYLDHPGLGHSTTAEAAHVFACFFQIRRAFGHIFRHLIGISRPAARFRAGVWQSIFTHDMRRYRRVMFERMADIPTLVTGPSGTGKELAARAIGLSRYIPFDSHSKRFESDVSGSFFPLNLSALSPTLIESELFGHRRGSFTGALEDHTGWLEICPRLGTVFLDEIGDLDKSIQVKLLRVCQSRVFQRIGDTKDRRFHGKIITATNRNLAKAMQSGNFREDLYYRLCADMVVTPSLYEQVTDSPDELRNLIQFIAFRLVGEEADRLADEAEQCIAQQVGPDYHWPGNIRELEQCVRNVLVRKEYRPAHRAGQARDGGGAGDLAREMQQGSITADELLTRYCRLVHGMTGSYAETARRLGLDRRTVRARVE